MAALCYLVLIAHLCCAVRRPVVLIVALGCGVHQPAVSCAHLAPVTTIGFVARAQKSKFIGAATTFSFEREVHYANETLGAYRPYPSSMLSSILCTRHVSIFTWLHSTNAYHIFKLFLTMLCFAHEFIVLAVASLRHCVCCRS